MSSIAAGTTTTTGYVVTSDSTGALVLKTGSSATTAVTIGSDQSVTFAGSQTFSGGTANGVLYLNGSKVATSGSSFSYDGAGVLTLGNDSVATVFNAVGDVAQYVVDSNGTGSSASHQWRYGSTEAMRLTSTGLGIGTSSPASALYVKRTSGNSGIYTDYNGTNVGRIEAASNGNLYIGITTGSGDLSIGNTASATALNLSASGNLGLGVTPSAWSYFKAMQVGVGSLVAPTNASNTVVYNNAYYDGSNERYVYSAYASQYQQLDGKHIWKTAGSGTAGNAITFTQAMTLDASGNLLVNRTSAQGTTPSRIQTSGSGTLSSTTVTRANTAGIYMSEAGGTANNGIGVWFDHGSLMAGIASSRVSTGNWGTDLRFYTHSDATSGNDETYERARISSSGNLLVGTTANGSPGLGVANSTNISFPESTNNTSLATMFRQAGTGDLVLGSGVRYSSTSTAFANSTDFAWARSAVNVGYGAIKFFTAAEATVAVGTDTTLTERARIDSSGNLLVATTSLEGNAKIVTVSATNGISARTTAAANSYEPIVASRTSTVGKAITLWYNLNTGQQAGFINIDSTSTVSLNNTSDYRVKEDIQPLTNAIARIQNLKPVSFKFKVDGYFAEGFIAHEFAEVIPQAVHGEKDAVDGDGKPVYQAIDQSKIIPLLTAAIQEQQAIIQQLQADVAALKGTA